MERKYDLAVVGAGAVGIAAARALSLRNQSLRICLLEKENDIATHQTGHNSGVIHSGIYYPKDSSKARFSIEGRHRLIEFCDDHDIPYDICGKVIVPTTDREMVALHRLYEQGLANGIPASELKMVDEDKLKDIEPYVKLHSPVFEALQACTTGIVNYPRITRACAAEFQQREGTILTNTQVIGIQQKDSQIDLITTNGTIQTKFLINCGGLYADTLATMMGIKTGIKIIPFRGEFYSLTEQAHYLVNNLIYPVPNPSLPFLGVHLTRTISGNVEAGPNAVLALAKEGYRKGDIQLEEILDILRFSGFWMMAKYWKTGLYELMRSYSKKLFTHSLQQLVPEITEDFLRPFGAGVRAQAVRADGSLVNDFLIVNFRNSLHVLNAPSPGATTCFAFGEEIADRVIPHFQ